MNERALGKAADYMRGWLQVLCERDTIPGYVVAVSHKGKVIFNEAYGYADLEKKARMTPQHIFRIASHSKTFTATAVMQLQEQGKLKIDDPVSDYLKWLTAHSDKRWRNVTIRQLLSHGAGVIRDGTDSNYWNVEKPFPDQDQLKKQILATGLVIDNNTKMKYSNYGYSLLGMVIEAASGKSYHDYVRENIIQPLDLKNTGPELQESIKDKLVTGYSRNDFNGKRLPIWPIDTRGMAAATGFYSTSEDLCTYFEAHRIGSGKLLNDESKKEMQKTHWTAEHTHDKEEYGLGLEIEYKGKHRLIGHGGGFPGNISKSYYDPERRLAVIVLTNANGVFSGYMGKNILGVIDFFDDKCKRESKFEKYEGKFINRWTMMDFVAGGDKLYAGWADGWDPFQNPDELEHITGDKFKITKTTSWDSPEEEVIFKKDNDGKVKSVVYAGATMYNPEEFVKKNLAKGYIG